MFNTGSSDAYTTVLLHWCSDSTTNCSNTWNQWCTSTGSTNTDQAWVYWNGQFIGAGQATWQPPTAEELERQREEARKRNEEKLAAKQRAHDLLVAALSERQRKELEQHRYFTVHGQNGTRRYRVHAGKGKHGNIHEVDEQGRTVASLCAAPQGDIPEGDYLLGQKLHLEHDEERFRRTANITPRRVA